MHHMPKTRRVRLRSWQATLILTLFFIAVAGAAGIGWWYARESPPHQGPIVMIAVDGLAAADVPEALPAPALAPPAGYEPEPVKEGLEGLVGESVVFERVYTHSPLFLPSHASLLSGRLPFEHGLRDEAGFELAPGTRTLAELLRNRGFDTAAVVSSPLLTRDHGLANGFGYFAAIAEPEEPGVTTAPSAAVPAAGTDGARAIAAADAWMAGQRGQRYFLLLQVDADHADQAVDRVTLRLRDDQLYDRATLVLVGARGSAAGRLDEEALHVPLLVKQPHREGAGRRVPTLVQHVDLLPTILDLVRAPLPGDLHGRSLRTLLDEGEDRLTPQPVYAELLAPVYRFGGVPLFALTVNDLRYLRSDTESVLRLDGADRGLAGVSMDAELAALRATLDRLITDAPSLPATLAVPPRARRAVAAAGYLAGLAPPRTDAALSAEEQLAIAAAHEAAAQDLAAGRLPAALQRLQQIGREHGTLAPVQFQIGVIAAELGRTQEAVSALAAAAALRPEAPDVPGLLALVLARAGRHTEALAHVETAIALAGPLGPRALGAAHVTAARVALLHDDVARAAMHAEAAQAADPTVPVHALVDAHRLTAADQHAEALAALERGVTALGQRGSELEGLHTAYGDTLVALGRAQEAETAYRDELRAHPGHVAAYRGLTLALREAGRIPEAEAVVERLIEAVPTPDGYAAAARLWTMLGDRARAEALRSDAQARFRVESPAQARLADVRRR